MPALYEQDEIRFLYPENWELDNRKDESTPWSVSVHSPSGAFWSIVVHDKGSSLSDLAVASLDALRQEYPESFFESESVHDQFGGQGVVGHDAQFFYLDFLISAKIRAMDVEDHPCIVLFQSELCDFEKLELVFRAITESLYQAKIK